MKKFCKKHNLTENQFLGLETVVGSLDLSLENYRRNGLRVRVLSLPQMESKIARLL